MRKLLAILLTLISLRVSAQSYTLDMEAKTSAGIYKEDGTLVRTLWSGQKNSTGTHLINWDGKDDDGNNTASGNYRYTVIENNVDYTWKGVIGNNSDNQTGSTVHRSMYGISDMARAGNKVYCALGYNEQWPALYKFDVNTPYQKQWILDNPNGNGTAEYVSNVCTDGKKVYWGAADPVSGHDFFVFATNVSDDHFYNFTGSQDASYDLVWGRIYPSVIGYRHTSGNNGFVNINGIAVQITGNYLYVSYSLENTVKVYNKVTGDFITNISINGVTRLSIQNDTFLWIASDNTIDKFIINPNGSLTKTGIQIKGVNAASLTISPDNSQLVISDMTPGSQQIKFYNALKGTLVSTFGQPGGYKTDATVADNKFHMYSLSEKFYPSIVYLENGDFWFVDQGNRRLLKFNANLQKIDEIIFQTTTYDIAVDPNDPTRVFCGYREFSIDYAKIEAGNIKSSWKLVRNWGYNIPPGFPVTNWGLKNVVTFPNGRTYCMIHKDGTPQRNWIAELVKGGNLRITLDSLSPYGNEWLKEDGNYSVSNSNGKVFYHATAKVMGYTKSNDPVYSNPVIFAQAPAYLSEPADNRRAGQITSTGLALSLREYHLPGTKWHLGAIQIGDTAYKWKTARELPSNYAGSIPLGDCLDQRNSIRNTNATVMTIGRNVFWNYPAELYMGDQANIYNHLWDNGLVIGQFGVTNVSQEAYPGSAGNSRSPVLIQFNGKTYIWANDEWDHAGVHLWEISGLNSIKEHTGIISKSSSVLALNFTSISTSCRNNETDIRWNTSSQEKLKAFEVEGSDDGSVWTTLGTTNKNEFAINGYNRLYRIAEVELDGEKEYSRVIKNICPSNFRYLIYPNPTKDVVRIVVKDNAKGEFRLFNNAGQMVKVVTFQNNPTLIDVAKLVPGIYYVEFNNSRQKFLKEE
jgi:hypothetical protein